MSSILIIRFLKDYFMKLTILRIENEIVNCQLDNGSIIDIARKWFTEDIQEGDTIEFDMNNC
ncbi:MAG: hypothetical protein HDR13_10730 [Lachnospiraceae bacterium]|nr:hypothetical protein [Lachnospiraceae bacterium]